MTLRSRAASLLRSLGRRCERRDTPDQVRARETIAGTVTGRTHTIRFSDGAHWIDGVRVAIGTEIVGTTTQPGGQRLNLRDPRLRAIWFGQGKG